MTRYREAPRMTNGAVVGALGAGVQVVLSLRQ
jgi:hypothetical protein